MRPRHNGRNGQMSAFSHVYTWNDYNAVPYAFGRKDLLKSQMMVMVKWTTATPLDMYCYSGNTTVVQRYSNEFAQNRNLHLTRRIFHQHLCFRIIVGKANSDSSYKSIYISMNYHHWSHRAKRRGHMAIQQFWHFVNSKINITKWK